MAHIILTISLIALACLVFQAFIPSSNPFKDAWNEAIPDRKNRWALLFLTTCFTLLGVWVALG